jgi:molybdenum cofactor cytidylyltransferase
VQAILLAAGLGRRFDPSGRRDKLLQDLGDGRTVLWHSASKLRTALGSCMAVIRPGQHERRRILEDAGCCVIESEAAREGMGAALAAAVQASTTAGGWLVALADMPWLAPELIRRVAAAIDTPDAVAAPWCDGRRGHPVAFGAAWRQRLAALEGDQGARELLARAAVRRIEPAPRAVLHDVDVPADLGAAPGGERARRTDRS